MKQFSSLWILTLTIGILSDASGQSKKKYDYLIVIKTVDGDIKVRLFDDTPNHKKNFIELVEEGYYDSTTFYRVLKNYVIQGGDPNSRPDLDSLPEGYGGPEYQLDAEVLGKYKPKRGLVGAARQTDEINPSRKSNGSQFFIIHDDEYSEILDGFYTFFGEVVEGMDVLDKIAERTSVDRHGIAKKKEYLQFEVQKFRARKFRKLMLRKYKVEL